MSAQCVGSNNIPHDTVQTGHHHCSDALLSKSAFQNHVLPKIIHQVLLLQIVQMNCQGLASNDGLLLAGEEGVNELHGVHFTDLRVPARPQRVVLQATLKRVEKGLNQRLRGRPRGVEGGGCIALHLHNCEKNYTGIKVWK